MKTKKFALGLLSGRNMHGSDSLKLKLVTVKKSQPINCVFQSVLPYTGTICLLMLALCIF